MSVQASDYRNGTRVARSRRGFGDIWDDYGSYGDESDESDLASDYEEGSDYGEYPSPTDPLYEEGFIDVVTYDLNEGEKDYSGVPIGPYESGMYASSDDGSMADYGSSAAGGAGGFILSPEVFGDNPEYSTDVIGDVIGGENDSSATNAADYNAGKEDGFRDGYNGAPYKTTAAQSSSYKEGYSKYYPIGQAAKKKGAPAPGSGPIKTTGGGGTPTAIGPTAPTEESGGMSLGLKLGLGAAALGIAGLVIMRKKRKKAA